MPQEKKIYIATFHHSMNYGAVLQTYALQMALKHLNYAPVCIDFRFEDHLPRRKKNIQESIKKTILSLYSIKKKYIFAKFRKRYLFLTRHFRSIQDLSPDFFKDAYAGICGSDQVWNLDIVPLNILPFFLLDCLPAETRKISYAASPVNLQKVIENKAVFQKSLKSFNNISCRERDAKEVLEEVSSKEVSIVLDPTLLVPADNWKKLELQRLIKEKYLLFYSFGAPQEMVSFAEKIAKEKKLLIVHLHKRSHFRVPNKSFANAGPREFITLFRDADFIVTNSFHGTAFSIIYQKDFVVQQVKDRASRMTSLAWDLGFSNRCVENVSSIDSRELAPINYDMVCKNLETLRAESFSFLSNSLE